MMAIDLNAYKQKAKQIQQDKALNAKQTSEKNLDQQAISQFKANKPEINTSNSVIPNFKFVPKSSETTAQKPLSFANTFKQAIKDFKRNREVDIDQLEEDLNNATTEQDIEIVQTDFNKLISAVKEKLHKKLQFRCLKL